jgi:hypothetical protein
VDLHWDLLIMELFIPLCTSNFSFMLPKSLISLLSGLAANDIVEELTESLSVGFSMQQ